MEHGTVERLKRDLEIMKIDLSVTEAQLNSKTEAVIILQKMLEKCEKERTEFKIMAEQVMNRYQLLRKTLCHGISIEGSANDLCELPNRQLASLLVESRQANKGLQSELMELKSRLSEAIGDSTILRKQLWECQARDSSPGTRLRLSSEELVIQMEQLTMELKECQRELVRCHDEKQELVAERDTYQNKCDRLHNELVYILNGNERKLIDIDTLIAEKRSLAIKLETAEEEKNLALSTMQKYKKLLQQRSPSKTSPVASDSNKSFPIASDQSQKTEVLTLSEPTQPDADLSKQEYIKCAQ